MEALKAEKHKQLMTNTLFYTVFDIQAATMYGINEQKCLWELVHLVFSDIFAGINVSHDKVCEANLELLNSGVGFTSVSLILFLSKQRTGICVPRLQLCWLVCFLQRGKGI